MRGKNWQNGGSGQRHNSTSRPVCAPSVLVCLNTTRKFRLENNQQSKLTAHRQASIFPQQRHTPPRSWTSPRQGQKSQRWRIEGNPTARVPRRGKALHRCRRRHHHETRIVPGIVLRFTCCHKIIRCSRAHATSRPPAAKSPLAEGSLGHCGERGNKERRQRHPQNRCS